MLNETLAFDSEEEKRLTGTETSPKEIVAVPIARAGIGRGERERVTTKTLTDDALGRK
jgi:hypothetical protein